MIQIDDKIISSEILEKEFCCDIVQCKGLCCVHGSSGAPVSAEEAVIIENILDDVKPYMVPAGIDAVELLGTTVTDIDGDIVTPLVDDKECAYVVFENGIATCAIEKAWLNKKVDFRKPISCHLYPIRVKDYETFSALNYDVWDVCAPARKLGESKGIPVYRFLKDAIIRAYGEDFFKQLEDAEKLLHSQNIDKT
ncbi:MAG: DUF3109 family protein [Bacteroidales bacterium]